MKLFIDNIPTLVTEVMLLAPISRMFCPKVVYKMKPDMIAQIASESEEKKWKREELSRKLKTLESGWGICRRHVARMKAGKPLPIHVHLSLWLHFSNPKVTGASTRLEIGTPKSNDSKVTAPTKDATVKPKVLAEGEVANREEEGKEEDEQEEE